MRTRCLFLLLFFGALSGCSKTRLTPCQTLVDQIARGTGQAAADACDAGRLRAAIQAAIGAVTSLEFANDRLSTAKDDYARGMKSALDHVGDDDRNRIAMDEVNAATFRTLSTVNLFCASQR